MRLLSVLLALLPACGFSSDKGTGSMGDDVPPDAQRCFGSFVHVCFDAVADLPTAPRTWSANADIDTDSSDAASLCDQHNDGKASYCVVAGAGLTVTAGATLRGHGTKPLVLLSTMPVQLDGSIDVSSLNNAAANIGLGAGGNPTGMCIGQVQAKGNSGGAGGSFAGQGGEGQRLGTAEIPSPSPPVVAFPQILRGGCPGGNGAKNNLVDAGGLGGSGGGAVAIIAPGITINDKINASGAGGKGGATANSGGGGGGSGGMIVLDVPATGIARGSSGIVFANGGGGGEGGSDLAGTGVAVPGADGATPAGPVPSAPGGATDADGGNGGAGSSDKPLGGANAAGQAASNGGGGAGGGGAGFIYAPGFAGTGVISPPSQQIQPSGVRG